MKGAICVSRSNNEPKKNHIEILDHEMASAKRNKNMDKNSSIMIRMDNNGDQVE